MAAKTAWTTMNMSVSGIVATSHTASLRVVTTRRVPTVYLLAPPVGPIIPVGQIYPRPRG